MNLQKQETSITPQCQNGQDNADSKKELSIFFRLPWHLLIFVLYPILFIITNNHVRFLDYALKPLLLTGLGAAITFLFLSLVLRSIRKAAIIVSLLTMVYMVYGLQHIPDRELSENDILFCVHFCSPYFTFNFFTAPILAFLGVTGLLLYRVKEVHIQNITACLNAMALFFLVIGCYNLVNNEIGINRDEMIAKQLMVEIEAKIRKAKEEEAAKPKERYPDIYMIIPDAFLGNMSTAYSSENIDDFIAALEQKGFEVPRISTSNYTATDWSIPSMMNMDYIHNLLPDHKKDDKNSIMYDKNNYAAKILKPMNRVQVFLESKGYTIFKRENWRTPSAMEEDIQTSQKKYADFFLALLTQTTEMEYRKKSVEQVVALFEMNKRMAREKSDVPRFIYSHIICPHVPYVFSEDGSYQGDKKGNYYVQRKFVCRQLIDVVDTILAESDHEPVIIIASDHGESNGTTNSSKLYKDILNPLGNLNHKNPQLAEHSVFQLNNFIAVYLPKDKRTKIPDEMCNVNIFRFVFNNLFNENFSLLPSMYFDHNNACFNSKAQSYLFYDVTRIMLQYLQDYEIAIKSVENTQEQIAE